MIADTIDEIVYETLLNNKKETGKSIMSVERIIEIQPSLSAEQVANAAYRLKEQGRASFNKFDNSVYTISLVNN